MTIFESSLQIKLAEMTMSGQNKKTLHSHNTKLQRGTMQSYRIGTYVPILEYVPIFVLLVLYLGPNRLR